jgi:hypothetical protein
MKSSKRGQDRSIANHLPFVIHQSQHRPKLNPTMSQELLVFQQNLLQYFWKYRVSTAKRRDFIVQVSEMKHYDFIAQDVCNETP